MKPIEKYLYPLILAVSSLVSLLIATALLLLKIPVLIFFSFLINIYVLLSIVAVVYGLVLLIKDTICRNYRIKNYAANIAAIFLSIIIFYTLFFSAYRRKQDIAAMANCNESLNDIRINIYKYTYNNNGYFPDCNQWCDLLIIFADASPGMFKCYNSDAVIGESSYAMNINLKGKKLSQIDPNTVIVFETNYGKGPNGRNVTVSTRYSYKVLKERSEDVNFFGEKPGKMKVYKNRWNQAGGQEMLSAENHKGGGANILFADGSGGFIKKVDFNNLNWGTETNIK